MWVFKNTLETNRASVIENLIKLFWFFQFPQVCYLSLVALPVEKKAALIAQLTSFNAGTNIVRVYSFQRKAERYYSCSPKDEMHMKFDTY